MSYWQLPITADWTLSASTGQARGGLAIPAGVTATTPAFCIGIDSPTFRFVGRGTGQTVVRVEILTANQLVISAGRVQLGNAAAASPVMLLTASALALKTADYSTSIRIRFVVESGAAQLDELWIDPFKGHRG